ncbi:Zn(2)-C6 fungal-type domain-containing protein [Favolaschia claudopus]|uniref:Zn(2)-C6 fungal-type domain-containing protein n=1 Tax=Favolaschia claudopus TaxID=2862362 RepID=A0AAW0DKR4_9AGAR
MSTMLSVFSFSLAVMASFSFQILTEQEIVNMKRSRGQMACRECQRRKLKCNKQFPCISCVRRGRADICPTGDLGPIGRGRRPKRSDRPTDCNAEPSCSSGSASPQSSPTPPPVPSVAFPHHLDCAGHSDDRRDFKESAFSCGSTGDGDSTSLAQTLASKLPDKLTAWALYHLYATTVACYATPITPDELSELIASFYSNPDTRPGHSAPHALSVLFFSFALARLADPSISVAESHASADEYFSHGCTAFTLQPIEGSSDLHTIQALVLAAGYYLVRGSSGGDDVAWMIFCIAVRQCQTLGYHREDTYISMEEKAARQRRDLFWELYSLANYQSISSGRRLILPATDITCEFSVVPTDSASSRIRALRWTFTKEVTAPTAEIYNRSTPPDHDEVVELDRRLQYFLAEVPFLQASGAPCSFTSYIRDELLPKLSGTYMMYQHRVAFMKTLKDYPLNPCSGPIGASVLAAYRGASMVIHSNIRSHSCFSERFHPWWPVWHSLINASFILGSIVTKCPTSEIAPVAFAELHIAVEIVEKGAKRSSIAARALPLLHRMRDKATTVYGTFCEHNLVPRIATTGLHPEGQDWLDRDPSPLSSTADLTLPSLIPNLMLAPSSPSGIASTSRPILFEGSWGTSTQASEGEYFEPLGDEF